MTPNTPYFIAGVTKMFTAAVTMMLYEEKRLDLGAPISDYLPSSLLSGIHAYKGIDYSRHIKVYRLLSHSSGLADFETGKPRGGKTSLMN